MAEAGGLDLAQFGRWYSQAGTPLLEVSGAYHADDQVYRLTVRQSCPETPGQTKQEPFLIPLAVGLPGPDGRDQLIRLAGSPEPPAETLVLRVTEPEQTFDLEGVAQPPVPSLLREFSAPVRLEYPHGPDDLAFLFAHDRDPFNRWEAGQRLARVLLLEMTEAFRNDEQLLVPTRFSGAFRKALTDRGVEPALLSLALTLPSEIELAEAMAVADPGAIHAARQALRRKLAEELESAFAEVMQGMTTRGPYAVTAEEIGRRSLKNLCLGYLTMLRTEAVADHCFAQFTDADNMTDRLAALTGLVHNRLPHWQEALAAFYHQYQDDALVVDKWFTLQAIAPGEETLAQVQELMEHPAFTLKNPNRVRSLIGAFTHANPAALHVPTGEGYRFVADQVMALDAFNPQVAARLVGPLIRWRRFDQKRQGLMRAQLERLRRRDGLSRDVGEMVEKSLQEN